jgi:hypothetical protein
MAEPNLEELASNPMQLTILLDLLHKHGEATPTSAPLCDSYVDLLLAREANTHPESVRKHQNVLREIIPFLGWHLHAHSEADRVNPQMTVADFKPPSGTSSGQTATPRPWSMSCSRLRATAYLG